MANNVSVTDITESTMYSTLEMITQLLKRSCNYLSTSTSRDGFLIEFVERRLFSDWLRLDEGGLVLDWGRLLFDNNMDQLSADCAFAVSFLESFGTVQDYFIIIVIFPEKINTITKLSNKGSM